MAKGKFDFLKSVNYGQDEQGRIRMFSDDQRNYFKAENEAKRKIEEANALKQKIADESYAIISQAQKEKAGFERMAAIGKGIDPRNWARGLFNAVTSNVQENIIGGGKAIGEQNAATNLYNQSKDLADQAAKIVKTDRPQAEALLRQSQALTEEANKFAQGEATKKIMGADGKLTGKEIFAKSALTGLELGSFLPVGTVVKGTGVLANVSTKVPATLQASKTVKVGNAITAALGLGDIYQVGKVGAQKGFGAAIQQTVFGQAGKATLQAPVMAGLMEAADDDGVNNYWGSVGTNAIGAFGVTLGLGYGAKVLGSVAQAGVSDISKMAGRTGAETVTNLAGALPMPPAPVKPVPEPQKLLPLPQEAIQATTIIDGKVVNLPPSAYTQPVLDRNVFEPKAQVIGTTTGEPLPNFFEKLGAFDPQETIPMVDITETIKGNNIDFNPDSVLSINATRKAIDDIALLTGNEVGGKQLKINFEDPKYKEVYNNMIKPLVDRINEVDANVKVAAVKPTKISPELEPLVQEAKKYKNKDEFIKSQGMLVYHASKADFPIEEIKINPNSKQQYLGQGVYFAKTDAYLADSYGKNIKNAIVDKKDFLDLSKLDVTERRTAIGSYGNYSHYLRDYKLKDTSENFAKYVKNQKNVADKIIAQGYKGVTDGGQYVVFDKSAIKTKSQLNNAWNQAQVKPTKATEISAEQVVEIRSQLDTFKADEQKIGIQLDQDKMLLQIITDELKTHPGKVLHKYANKREGKLPEITGKGKSIYARTGDSLMTELGFESDDEAQEAYASFLKLKNQRESLKADIRESKSFLKDISIEQKTLQKQLKEVEVPTKALEPQYISSKDVQKVPVEDVEMEVQKIYSELENAGINIVPEQVRLTPNIQTVDDKLAKGEIPTPEEFDKGMKEYVNSTGRTEVIDGVQEELTGPMKKSSYAERLRRENPDLNLSSVDYQAAVVKDLEEVANNLIETNFDEAGKIARSINKNSSLQDIKIGELYINKLIELGKNDELAQVYGSFSAEATRSGQRTGILQQKKIGTPQYALKQATDARLNKLKPQIDKEVAKVKQEMSSVVIDQTVIFDILDNITCR